MTLRIFSAIFSVLLVGCEHTHVPLMISSNHATAESVFLTHDHQGNPAVVWTEKQNDKRTLFFAKVGNDGTSVSNYISLPITEDVSTHAESMPKIAFKQDGTVIVAYQKKAPTNQNKYASAIYYVMSVDGGKSWTEETFLHSDTVAGKSRSYFDIERLPDGEVGATWLDIKLNNDTGGRSVRFARTTPTQGFANEILIDSSACQCCRLDIYTDKRKNIFIAYRGLARGPMGSQIRDMMISTSTDLGTTFSRPITISADNWNIDGCPHTGPSLCGSKAGLISLWYTEGMGTGIYYAEKSTRDTSFSARKLVSRSGHHPQLTANEDRIAMVWEENIDHNGKQKTVIHYRISKAGVDVKNNTLTPHELNAFLPVVTTTNSSFLVAYLMEQDNRVGVYLTTLK